MKKNKNNGISKYKLISLASLSTIAFSSFVGDVAKVNAMVGRVPGTFSKMASSLSNSFRRGSTSSSSIKSAVKPTRQPAKPPMTDISGRFQSNHPHKPFIKPNRGGSITSGKVTASTQTHHTSSTGTQTPNNYNQFNSSLLSGTKKPTSIKPPAQPARPVAGNGSVVTGGDSIVPIPSPSTSRRPSFSSQSSSTSTSTSTSSGRKPSSFDNTSLGTAGDLDGNSLTSSQLRKRRNKQLKYVGLGVIGLGALTGIGIGVGVAVNQNNKNKQNASSGSQGIPPKPMAVPEIPRYSGSVIGSAQGNRYTDD